MVTVKRCVCCEQESRFDVCPRCAPSILRLWGMEPIAVFCPACGFYPMEPSWFFMLFNREALRWKRDSRSILVRYGPGGCDRCGSKVEVTYKVMQVRRPLALCR